MKRHVLHYLWSLPHILNLNMPKWTWICLIATVSFADVTVAAKANLNLSDGGGGIMFDQILLPYSHPILPCKMWKFCLTASVSFADITVAVKASLNMSDRGAGAYKFDPPPSPIFTPPSHPHPNSLSTYGTGKKKRLSYLVGNLVATNWPIEKALHAIGYNQIPTK